MLQEGLEEEPREINSSSFPGRISTSQYVSIEAQEELLEGCERGLLMKKQSISKKKEGSPTERYSLGESLYFNID